MTRKNDPYRLAEAKRAGLRSRLIGEGMPPAEVDRLLEAWDAQGDVHLTRDYGEPAYQWIADKRR
jgi:hypothetical protein